MTGGYDDDALDSTELLLPSASSFRTLLYGGTDGAGLPLRDCHMLTPLMAPLVTLFEGNTVGRLNRDGNVTETAPFTWENVTTACLRCNVRKGNRTPKEASMPLSRVPRRPASRLSFEARRQIHSGHLQEWAKYVIGA